MEDLQTILDFVSAGGDAATAFIAWAIWRIDRRVFRLELLTGGKNEKLA